MFDFPQPFGPTIAVIPSWSSTFVRSAKDLKPWSVRDLIRNDRSLGERFLVVEIRATLAAGSLCGS